MEENVARERLSTDIWDYLVDMPNLPSRADRDVLVAAALEDSEAAKRVRLWDLFFPINPADVGRPQKVRRAQLWAEDIRVMSARLDTLRTGIGRRMNVIRFCAVLAVALAVLPFAQPESSPLGLAWAMVPLLASAWALWSSLGLRRRLKGLQQEITQAAKVYGESTGEPLSPVVAAPAMSETELERQRSVIARDLAIVEDEIVRLKRQIPDPPQPSEVNAWFEEDIRSLNEQAKRRCGLANPLVEIEGMSNPLYISGPAELQAQDAVPEPYWSDPDKRKHLTARRLCNLPDGRFADFYGVYYLEFILIGPDMLFRYGCFFDFISGRTSEERTTEHHNGDVVSINTRRVYRVVEMGDKDVPIEDSPAFGVSLSSGERQEVVYAAEGYLNSLRREWGDASSGIVIPSFDSPLWVRNPYLAAERALTALRGRLRAYRGAQPGEVEQPAAPAP